MASIEVRNLKFDDANVPRHWHGGRKSVTTFFDNLSVFFPAGERFFIAAVRAHQSKVDDVRLAADVRAFFGQEGVHSREHERYNRMLARQGYPVKELEQDVERLLARVTRRTPKRLRLAITCALEHFTALMGHFLLEDPRMMEGADPTMSDLWRWHAAEENEHKAVAYDVFLAAGGTYGERVAAMIGASVIFWAKVLQHQARMMKVDGTALSAREWLALGRFLFVSPGGLRKIVPHYFRYYRPSFHPNDIDSSRLFDAWKRVFDATPSYGAAA